MQIASGAVADAAACEALAKNAIGVNVFNFQKGKACVLRKCTEPAKANLLETTATDWADYVRTCTADGMLGYTQFLLKAIRI